MAEKPSKEPNKTVILRIVGFRYGLSGTSKADRIVAQNPNCPKGFCFTCVGGAGIGFPELMAQGLSGAGDSWYTGGLQASPRCLIFPTPKLAV